MGSVASSPSSSYWAGRWRRGAGPVGAPRRGAGARSAWLSVPGDRRHQQIPKQRAARAPMRRATPIFGTRRHNHGRNAPIRLLLANIPSPANSMKPEAWGSRPVAARAWRATAGTRPENFRKYPFTNFDAKSAGAAPCPALRGSKVEKRPVNACEKLRLFSTPQQNPAPPAPATAPIPQFPCRAARRGLRQMPANDVFVVPSVPTKNAPGTPKNSRFSRFTPANPC